MTTTSISAVAADLRLTKRRVTPAPEDTGLFPFNTPITYEVVYANVGNVDIPPQIGLNFDDVQLPTLPNARMGSALSTTTAFKCEASGGATCPGDAVANSAGAPRPYFPFNPGMIRGLPAGSRLTYTYTVKTENTSGIDDTCGDSITMYNQLRSALSYSPRGGGTVAGKGVVFLDANGVIESPNEVSTALTPPRRCTLAPAEVTISKKLVEGGPSITTSDLVKTFEFTVTRNSRDAAADAIPLTLSLGDQMLYRGWKARGGPVTHTAEATGCTATGSGECPTQWAGSYPLGLVDTQISGITGTEPKAIQTAYPFTQTAPTVTLNAVGDTVTFRVRLGYAGLDSVTCIIVPSALSNRFGVGSFGKPSGYDDWNLSVPDNQGLADDVPIASDKPQCIDLAVNKKVAPVDGDAGQTMSFTLDFSNNRIGVLSGERPTAINVPIRDVLGSQFLPLDVSCSRVAGTDATVAPTVSLADITGPDHTFAAVIPSLEDGGLVRCEVTGVVLQAGRFSNTADIPISADSALYDVNMADNTSTQAYGIGAPASITLTKQLEGATAGYVAGTTFPVEVVCTVDRDGAVTTIPQTVNLLPGVAQTLTIPAETAAQTVACTVAEGTLPAPAANHAWGTSVVLPAAVNGLGPTDSAQVLVSNLLVRQSGAIALQKTVAGGPTAGLTASFTFNADCGADGNFSGSVALAGASSGTGSIAGVPAGANCTVSEATPLPTPPTGYAWAAVPSAVTVTTVADSEVSAAFTNTLGQAPDMSVSITGLPPTAGPGAVLDGTLTCTNGTDMGVALHPVCTAAAEPDSGVTVTLGTCTPALPVDSLAAGATITCPITVTLPGTPGGADEPKQVVAIGGSTTADGDSNPANNTTSVVLNIIDALDDRQTATVGTAASLNVLDNDQSGLGAATLTNVTITVIAAPPAGASFDPATGVLATTASTAPGTYSMTYQICTNPALTPPQCDQATAQIIVEGTAGAVQPVPGPPAWLIGLLLAALGMLGFRARRPGAGGQLPSR